MNTNQNMCYIHDDKPKCFCGVVGAFGVEDAATNVYYALHALQHRGQESAGIVTSSHNDNNSSFHVYKGAGLVSEVFDNPIEWRDKLIGDAAIGHNRYSTTGAANLRRNIAPFVVNYRCGHLAVAHNGNLTNEYEVRKELVEDGAIFQTTTDSEVILHLIARSKQNTKIDQIIEALSRIKGAYSLVILTDDKLFAARDPYGFKPLALGKKNNGFMIASETCAFDINAATYLRDVKPGEIVIIDREAIEKQEVKSVFLPYKAKSHKQCIFEYIYFSRPDSKIYGHSVDKIRRRLGKILARKHPVYDKDGEKVIVISVPDSSNTAALGYATHLNKQGINAKFELGLIRSHYIGRTFISPGQNKREMGVRVKFNVVRGVIEGRTVVVVDDSIVRGTTSKLLMNLIREANPKALHMRISSPPIMHPCFYGMDFPSKEELIANKMFGDIEEIRRHIAVDSLEYLTIEELLESVYDDNPESYCNACFSGKYPTKVNLDFKKEQHDSQLSLDMQ